MSSGTSDQPFIGKRIVTLVCSNCNREFTDEDEIRIDPSPKSKATPKQRYASQVAFAIQTGNFGEHVCPYCQSIQALPKYAPDMSFSLFSPIAALMTGALVAYFVATTLSGWINFTRTGIGVVFQNALPSVLGSVFIYLVFYFIAAFIVESLKKQVQETREGAHAQSDMQFRVSYSPHPPGVREFGPHTQNTKGLVAPALFAVCVLVATVGLQYGINRQQVVEQVYIANTVLRYVVAFELAIMLCAAGLALFGALVSGESPSSIGKGTLAALLFVGCGGFFVILAGLGMNGAWVELHGYSAIDPHVSDTCDNLAALSVRDDAENAVLEGKVWIYAPVSFAWFWATDRRGATSLDELTTLLCVTEATKREENYCSYNDGATYDFEGTYWDIAVVDWKTKEIVESQTLYGDGCPPALSDVPGNSDSGTIKGDPPSNKALKNLLDDILARAEEPSGNDPIYPGPTTPFQD